MMSSKLSQHPIHCLYKVSQILSKPYKMYSARHHVYIKCQLFISMVEQIETIRFSALNSSILMMKWDCGGPRICQLWSSYLNN